MNYTVLLGYVKKAWKNYLREGNVSTLRWDCEDTEEVGHGDFSNLAAI